MSYVDNDRPTQIVIVLHFHFTFPPPFLIDELRVERHPVRADLLPVVPARLRLHLLLLQQRGRPAEGGLRVQDRARRCVSKKHLPKTKTMS